MKYLGTREQLKKYDQLILKHENISIKDLVYKAASKIWPYLKNEDAITIVAGKGNNGADALCLACMLLNKHKTVHLFLSSPIESFNKTSLYYLEEYTKFSNPVYQIRSRKDLKLLKERMSQSNLVVDGIFGYGFEGSVDELIAALIDTINQSTVPVLSIDVPSGMDVNVGARSTAIVKASLTITFVCFKPGFFLEESKPYLGQVRVESLPFMEAYLQMAGISQILTRHTMRHLIRPRDFYGYKYNYGHLGLYVGSDAYRGAALISCGAALKTGCGLVQLNAIESVNQLVLARYPEVVVSNSSSKICDAIVFGCGKGLSEQTKNELVHLLQTYQGKLLIDADGINALAKVLPLLDQCKAKVVLTPHIGEFKRLIGLNQQEDKDLEREAMIFAAKHHLTLVLKGPHTLITDGHACFKNIISNRAMATAGMGDCLAGMIGALLANHYEPIDACKLGVYLHGCCGDRLGHERYSVFASDMIDEIPKEMYALLKGN